MNSNSKKTLEELSKKVKESTVIPGGYSPENRVVDNDIFPGAKLTKSIEVSPEKEDSPIKKLEKLLDGDKIEIQPIRKLNLNKQKIKFKYGQPEKIPESNRKIEEILSKRNVDFQSEIDKIEKRINASKERMKTEYEEDRKLDQLSQRLNEHIGRSREALEYSENIRRDYQSAINNEDLIKTRIKTNTKTKDPMSTMKETIKLDEKGLRTQYNQEIKRRRGLSLTTRGTTGLI